MESGTDSSASNSMDDYSRLGAGGMGPSAFVGAAVNQYEILVSELAGEPGTPPLCLFDREAPPTAVVWCSIQLRSKDVGCPD
jgi:hypothetical protein